MDPNNIQQPTTMQAAQQPVQANLSPMETSPSPKPGSKKGIILLAIVLILALGMGSYVLFAKKQLSTTQDMSTYNKSTIVPTSTIAPTITPATVEELNVENPSSSSALQEINTDLQGL